jgi:hypothetical protein
MSKIINLEDWSVVYPAKDPYTPPEFVKISLHGTADDHPKLGKNADITTSSVVSSEGRLVKTTSGHTYRLGKPSQSYLAWLKVNNIKLDEDQPVKI